MSFNKLLAELDALAINSEADSDLGKSMAADEGEAGDESGADGVDDEDDAGIAAAAEEGEEAGAAEEAEGEDAGEDGAEDFGKSFRFTTDDGNEHEGVDATEMLKSLVGRMDSSEAMLGKALGQMIDLVKSQGSAITALNKEVSRLGSSGRGRKTVVSISEKPGPETMAKSDPADEGIGAGEFMAKCMVAQGAGKLTGREVARAESYINRGLDVPADIKAKVFA